MIFWWFYTILSPAPHRGECFAPPPSSRGSAPSFRCAGAQCYIILISNLSIYGAKHSPPAGRWAPDCPSVQVSHFHFSCQISACFLGLSCHHMDSAIKVSPWETSTTCQESVILLGWSRSQNHPWENEERGFQLDEMLDFQSHQNQHGSILGITRDH